MTHGLDDLPKRPASHRIEAKAVAAFESLIADADGFALQTKDTSDYGTDCQIEVMDGDSATNVRLHVQLKGTEADLNADGTLSVSGVRRQTLSYLLAQPLSFLVSYHVPSRTLRWKAAEAVARDYQHHGIDWFGQDTITVRFADSLTIERLQGLASLARAAGASSRDFRMAQSSASPQEIPGILRDVMAPVHVPQDPDRAAAMLMTIYESGQDAVLTAAFDQFASILGRDHDAMTFAYMSEINRGMAGRLERPDRIADGIKHLIGKLVAGRQTQSSLYYSIGNGCSALDREEDAIKSYERALGLLLPEDTPDIQAQIHKNMGSGHEKLGDTDKALKHYREALKLNPLLAEAHFAMGMHFHRRGEYAEALDHFDNVVFAENTLGRRTSSSGWRINALFSMGDPRGAFRDINILLSDAAREEWIWPWSAQQVSTFGRTSVESAKQAATFWERYRVARPGCPRGEGERLLNTFYLHSEGQTGDLTFEAFKADFETSIAPVANEAAAFLWDRLGHWAQEEGKWEDAASCYRQAYDLDGGEYGYCLAMALNRLGRGGECLPIALEQAETIQPDALSWFQVAVAYELVGSPEEAIATYGKVIQLNPEDEDAWFNLGGIFWNAGMLDDAAEIWNEAIERFPGTEQALKAQLKMAIFMF